MSYKNKVCPVCNIPFKNHHVTLHSSEAWAKCILEALDMDFDDVQNITEWKKEKHGDGEGE